jgi:hypothetical protein
LKFWRRLILLVAVAAIGFWIWRAVFPPPQKVIFRRLQRLAEAASVHAGQGYLPRMAGAQRVGGLCAGRVEINIDLPTYHQQMTLTRDDIVQNLMAAKLNGGLTVRFPDINVTVAKDGMSARADVTLKAHVPGEQDDIIQQMRVTFQKIDGDWLITKVETVRTFSMFKPALTPQFGSAAAARID